MLRQQALVNKIGYYYKSVLLHYTHTEINTKKSINHNLNWESKIESGRGEVHCDCKILKTFARNNTTEKLLDRN